MTPDRAAVFPLLFPYGTTARAPERPWATMGLILAHLIAFVVFALGGEGLMDPLRLARTGSPLGFLTYSFVPENLGGGALILLLNLYLLFIFARAIEEKAKWWRLLLLYFGASALAGLIQMLLDQGATVAGSSGGTFGVIGGFMMLFPFASVRCFFVLVIVVFPIMFRRPEIPAIFVVLFFWAMVALFPLLLSAIPVFGLVDSDISIAPTFFGLLCGALLSTLQYGFYGFSPEADEDEAREMRLERQLRQSLSGNSLISDPLRPGAIDLKSIRAAGVVPPELAKIHEYILNGRHDDARSEFARVLPFTAQLSLPPGPQLDLARAMNRMGEHALAVEAYHRMLRVYRDHDAAGMTRFELANVLVEQQTDLDDARELLTEFLRDSPPLDLEREAQAMLRQLESRPTAHKAGPAPATTELFEQTDAPVAPPDAGPPPATTGDTMRFDMPEEDPFVPDRKKAPTPPPLKQPPARSGPSTGPSRFDEITSSDGLARSAESVFGDEADTQHQFDLKWDPDDPANRPRVAPPRREESTGDIPLRFDETGDHTQIALPHEPEQGAAPPAGDVRGLMPSADAHPNAVEEGSLRPAPEIPARRRPTEPPSPPLRNEDISDAEQEWLSMAVERTGGEKMALEDDSQDAPIYLDAVLDDLPPARSAPKPERARQPTDELGEMRTRKERRGEGAGGGTILPVPSDRDYLDSVSDTMHNRAVGERSRPDFKRAAAEATRFALIVPPSRPIHMSVLVPTIAPVLGMRSELAHHALLHRRGIVLEGSSRIEIEDQARVLARNGQAMGIVAETARDRYPEALDVLRLDEREGVARFATATQVIETRWTRVVCLSAAAVRLQPVSPPRGVIDVLLEAPNQRLRIWRNSFMFTDAAMKQSRAPFHALARWLAERAPHALRTRPLDHWLEIAREEPEAEFHSLIEYENLLRWHVLAYLAPMKLVEAEK